MSFMQSHSKTLLLQVALACIAQSAESRPKMKQVAEFFEQIQPSSWHTLGVSCHVFFNKIQVYRYDAHAESMHHEREGPKFIRINHCLLSRPPQVSRRQASRTRLANVMDGYHLKVLRHLMVSTTCGLKLTLTFSIWDKNIILVPTSCRSPILSDRSSILKVKWFANVSVYVSIDRAN